MVAGFSLAGISSLSAGEDCCRRMSVVLYIRYGKNSVRTYSPFEMSTTGIYACFAHLGVLSLAIGNVTGVLPSADDARIARIIS